MGKFDGQIAIVTGAARGIGRTIATQMVREGAKAVYSFDVGDGPGDAGINDVKIDIRDSRAVTFAIDRIAEKEGRVDIVINNAGITRDGLVQNIDETAWDDVLDINLKGAFHVVKAAVPYMLGQGKGAIVNISSIVGVYGNIGQSNYAASKAGTVGLTYTWAKEFSRKGAQIRTNCVAPGYTNTEMIRTVPEKIIENLKAGNPLKRLGEPEEIAAAVCFLASDEASFVNGQVLSVDGGMRL
ncbi:MAG: SDR family oxidoreductase [Clostridiales Family XIII bacterium]|jgi:3-oxoacyl-[acyl-carrier protein] reductase|nr:SDR family oxidoreductase [Clostridiales Family XIII bacterium]